MDAIKTLKENAVSYNTLVITLERGIDSSRASKNWKLNSSLVASLQLVRAELDYHLGILSAVAMPRTLTVKVDFNHDLEDSWLTVYYLGGLTKQYNHWLDAKRDVVEYGVPAFWIGPDDYMPEDFHKELKVFAP